MKNAEIQAKQTMMDKLNLKLRSEGKGKVWFHGERLQAVLAVYMNGNTCIQLVDSEGMPYMTASVNPSENLADTEVAIKDYSENKGILAVLVDADIISAPQRVLRSGFVLIPVCTLLLGNIEPYKGE